jgi:hypothetical protein
VKSGILKLAMELELSFEKFVVSPRTNQSLKTSITRNRQFMIMRAKLMISTFTVLSPEAFNLVPKTLVSFTKVRFPLKVQLDLHPTQL